MPNQPWPPNHSYLQVNKDHVLNRYDARVRFNLIDMTAFSHLTFHYFPHPKAVDSSWQEKGLEFRAGKINECLEVYFFHSCLLFQGTSAKGIIRLPRKRSWLSSLLTRGKLTDAASSSLPSHTLPILTFIVTKKFGHVDFLSVNLP